jgi:metal-responsive CopG/Arc/MetJ family transcriptional regulator
LAERVTVTMPAELVAEIDRSESNRSRFIAEAVRHELQRRLRLELQCSLQSPHPESLATAALAR